MPEGDSYAHHAHRLGALLAGEVLIALDGTGGVRRSAARLQESPISEVRTHGKHLLIDFESGWTIHVQLGMSGRWRFEMPAREAASAGGRTPALSLRTRRGIARCFDAPTVEVDRTATINRRLERIGPDLLARDAETEGIVLRWRLLSPEAPVCDALLDQRVAAGVGNVYKNEVLFIERIHPLTPVGALDDSQIRDLTERARRLLASNASRSGPRNTGVGAGSWVYRRSGRPCRRCGVPILSDRLGAGLRATYWCPGCQRLPEPTSP